MARLWRSDWVTTKEGGLGSVIRIARDGTWADVRWRDPDMDPQEWSKRMPIASLFVVLTLPMPGGTTVTDTVREESLERHVGPFRDFCRKCEAPCTNIIPCRCCHINPWTQRKDRHART